MLCLKTSLLEVKIEPLCVMEVVAVICGGGYSASGDGCFVFIAVFILIP
jgi:hypothetical protein